MKTTLTKNDLARDILRVQNQEDVAPHPWRQDVQTMTRDNTRGTLYSQWTESVRPVLRRVHAELLGYRGLDWVKSYRGRLVHGAPSDYCDRGEDRDRSWAVRQLVWAPENYLE